jgi:hypothetical protein
MRNPVQSEADAFHIVVGSGLVIVAAGVVAALAGPVVGLVLVGGAVGAVGLWEVLTRDPERRQPLKEAMELGRANAGDGRRRVLVVANRTLESSALRDEVAERARAGDAVRVIVPILCSRAHYIASDTDRELAEARARLGDVLHWAQEERLDLTGAVGDPMVALGAIEDELRSRGADEVLISTHPPKQSNWLETGIVARLRAELDVPVTHLVVETAARQPA